MYRGGDWNKPDTHGPPHRGQHNHRGSFDDIGGAREREFVQHERTRYRGRESRGYDNDGYEGAYGRRQGLTVPRESSFDDIDVARDREFIHHGRSRPPGREGSGYVDDGYERDHYGNSPGLHGPRGHEAYREQLTESQPWRSDRDRYDTSLVDIHVNPHDGRDRDSYIRTRPVEDTPYDYGFEENYQHDRYRNKQGDEQYEMEEIRNDRNHSFNVPVDPMRHDESEFIFRDGGYRRSVGGDRDQFELRVIDRQAPHTQPDGGYKGSASQDGDQFELRVMDRQAPHTQHDHVHINHGYNDDSADYSLSDNGDPRTSGFDQNIVYNNTIGEQQAKPEDLEIHIPDGVVEYSQYNGGGRHDGYSDTDSLYQGRQTNRRRSKFQKRQGLSKIGPNDQKTSFADGMKTLVRRRQTIRIKSENLQRSIRREMAESGHYPNNVETNEDLYEDLNDIMVDENLPSTRIPKTKSLKHRLATLHREGTVSTAQTATLLRDHILTKEPSKLKGLDLHKYQISTGWQRFKNWMKSRIYQLELWSGAFKVIEGKFGTATMSYFRFLRWLMFLNMFLTIFMLAIVFLPFMLMQPNTDFSASVTECDSEYHYRAVYLSKNYTDMTANQTSSESTSQIVLDFLQGTGLLENTELFYGRYHNKTSTLLDGTEFVYHMGLAYVFAVGISFLLSFVLLVKNSAKGFKQSVMMSSSGNVTLYCNKVFGAWDYCIAQGKTSNLKHQNILQDFKNELEYQRLQWKKESRTKREKAKLYFIRIFVNLLVVSILVSSLYLIYFTNTTLIELSTQERNEALQLILQYLPSIVITLLGVIVPMIFNKVVIAEDYMPAFRIRITLTRIVLLRLASLGILMISLYTGLTNGRKHKTIEIPCNVTIHDNTDTLEDSTTNTTSSPGGMEDIPCWENYVGQQIYKLVMLNFLVVIAVTFLWEFPRKLLFKRFHTKVKVIDLLGQQQFDLTKNVLDLIYLQTLCWLGMFFSPLIPAMCFVKCFIFFYIKKTSLLHNCLPMQEYGTSRSNSLFMMVLLLSFGLAAIPIAAMMGMIQPSQACGPFRVYSSEGFVMFDVITNLVNSWASVKIFLHFIATGGFMALVGLLLCILMYYFYIAGQAHYHVSENLKEQLKVEGRDKQFLLARVNEALELDNGEDDTDDNSNAATAVAAAAGMG